MTLTAPSTRTGRPAATFLPPATGRVLEGPFASPPSPAALQPSSATQALVRSQVDALLEAAPSYHSLSGEDKSKLREGLVRIGAYSAECVRDICWQSQRLGQTPVVRRREPLALAQTSRFQPAAANQIARVTEQTLRAIAFPTFVADLIRGTFNAIVQTSIQQMEAFVQLVANVSGTVDQFMANNISDFQARDWLAQRYPEHIQIRDGQATLRDGAEERPTPDLRADLNLPDAPSSLDESVIEERLVPAARRRLAETRMQVLSTLVLMGVNRIVVTGGKIRATMGFHIDTTDRAHEEEASQFDFRTAASASFGFGPWSASASMSLSYVRSTRASSDAELNVESDLTGEVEIHFKSDYFPVERFANSSTLGAIRNNTAVPEANPAPASPANPLGSAGPAAGGAVERYTSPRTRRSPRPAPPPPVSVDTPLPPARMPERPTPVDRPAPSPSTPSTPAAPATPPAAATPATPPASTAPPPGGTATTTPPSGGETSGSEEGSGDVSTTTNALWSPMP